MRTVAVILARGGSKRLPRKNVLPFCGLPLVAWSIIQAKCSRLVDEVWLSTDDDEIADIGEKYGATVVRRPDWPNVDTMSGQQPTEHLLRAVLKTGECDAHISVLPTSPLRQPDYMDRLVARYYAAGDPERRAMYGTAMRETILYEDVNDGIQLSVWDKTYRYITAVGGTRVQNPNRWLSQTANDSKMDADSSTMELLSDEERNRIYLYVPGEMWQHADTDTREEFELAEVLMEHYILQGRGRSVYDDYAEGR